jgi:hypothetical protein
LLAPFAFRSDGAIAAVNQTGAILQRSAPTRRERRPPGPIATAPISALSPTTLGLASGEMKQIGLPRRRRAVWISASAIATVAIGIGVIALIGRGSSEVRPARGPDAPSASAAQPAASAPTTPTATVPANVTASDPVVTERESSGATAAEPVHAVDRVPEAPAADAGVSTEDGIERKTRRRTRRPRDRDLGQDEDILRLRK